MARPIVVPDSLRLDPLLTLLRADGFQLAVVLDEYAGFAGIVTLEDAVEEILGDIADEHDRLGSRAFRLRDGGWSISGLLRPDEVQDVSGIALPEHEDYDTVAGLVLRTLGRLPRPGDVAEVPLPDLLADEIQQRAETARTALLEVVRMDGLRVDRLALRIRRDHE